MPELWSLIVIVGLIGSFAVARRSETVRLLLTGIDDDAPPG